MKKRSNISVKYKRIDLSDEFPISYIHHIQNQAMPNFLHFHNGLEIGFCCDGNGVFFVNNQTLQFSKNDITIISQDQPHIAQSPMDYPSEWFFLVVDIPRLFCKGELAEVLGIDEATDIFHSIPNLFTYQQNPELSTLVRWIFSELESENIDYQSLVKQYLLSLLIKLKRISRNDSRQHLIPANPAKDLIVISPAINYMMNNYEKEIYLGDLAKMCSVSPSYLRKLFAANLQISPLEYLSQVRLNMSRSLLNSTSLSITSIAFDIGYESLNSFERQFKNHFGLSPSEYRSDFIQKINAT